MKPEGEQAPLFAIWPGRASGWDVHAARTRRAPCQ